MVASPLSLSSFTTSAGTTAGTQTVKISASDGNTAFPFQRAGACQQRRFVVERHADFGHHAGNFNYYGQRRLSAGRATRQRSDQRNADGKPRERDFRSGDIHCDRCDPRRDVVGFAADLDLQRDVWRRRSCRSGGQRYLDERYSGQLHGDGHIHRELAGSDCIGHDPGGHLGFRRSIRSASGRRPVHRLTFHRFAGSDEHTADRAGDLECLGGGIDLGGSAEPLVLRAGRRFNPERANCHYHFDWRKNTAFHGHRSFPGRGTG